MLTEWHHAWVPDAIDIVHEFKNVVVALSEAKLPFAVCGGFAVAIYGHVRATKDIDLLVEENTVESTFAALRPLGFSLRAGPISFAANTPQERNLFRATKVVGTERLTINLLVVSPVLAKVWSGRREADWAGLSLWVVSRAGLGEMKTLAGRKQDLADLEALGIEVKP